MSQGGSNTVNEMDAWVEFYKTNDLVYFPLFGILNGVCRCPSGVKCGTNTGKHPCWPWKDQPARTPRQTDNIGVSTNNLVVIDIDGDVTEASLDEYPRTFTTSTGHGFHLWYKADPTKNVKSLVGWKPKVDIRAIGGLVVAPPSRHRSGTVYRHVRGDSIQPVPRSLLDSLPEKGSAPHRKIGYTVTSISTDTHPVFAPLGRRLIETMESTSDARNQTLFRLGCRYFELAAGGSLGVDVLADLFAAAVRSGLTAEEVERTLESARKSV